MDRLPKEILAPSRLDAKELPELFTCASAKASLPVPSSLAVRCGAALSERMLCAVSAAKDKTTAPSQRTTRMNPGRHTTMLVVADSSTSARPEDSEQGRVNTLSTLP